MEKFKNWNEVTNQIEDFKILDYLNKKKVPLNNLPPRIQERYYKYTQNGNISDPLPKLKFKKRKVHTNSKDIIKKRYQEKRYKTKKLNKKF